MKEACDALCIVFFFLREVLALYWNARTPSLILKSELHEQTHQMKINYNYLDLEQVKMGIPQCSLFGPLLFLVEINYFHCNLFPMQLYASYACILSVLMHVSFIDFEDLENKIVQLDFWQCFEEGENLLIFLAPLLMLKSDLSNCVRGITKYQY